MLATIVHRGLTVWIDPVARSARIQVHMPGRPEEHVVLVQPQDGGWTMIDDLQKAKPEDFDKKYLDKATSVHNDALNLMKDYADHGDNAPIKAFAADTAPKVQMHLDMITALDRAG